MIRHLTAADYRVMPWANGRGQTIEMIRIEGPQGLLWRLSLASVVEDGPFSVLPGVNRNLTVIAGPGFDLLGNGVRLRANPLSPVAFDGGLALSAVGVAGPSDDFNVMTAAHLSVPEVSVIRENTALAAGGMLGVLALGPVQVADSTLVRGDLLLSDSALTVTGLSISVRISE